jgi:class 3 adenylate cyclase/DNA-binding CsgD family transcriptional regulator/tetratricopeptide (TPR) repeat protein
MDGQPTGHETGPTVAAVITFLFTDLVGSTELLERLGDDDAETLRRTHFRILREAVTAAGGQEVKNLGDGLMVAFESAVAAVDCAVAIQRAVQRHNRGHPARRLEVRVGLHVGEPIRDEDDYFGHTVVVAKRLCDAAAGGQILASDLVRGLVGSRSRFHFEPVGPLALKGLAEPLAAYEVNVDAPVVRPPGEGRSGPPASRFVGRARELAVLEAELVRAGDGALRAVLLIGEPGMGKTRLIAELLARYADDVLSLSARAYPLGATASLGLWVEALDGHLRSLGPEEVAELCGPAASDLAGLLPAVAATGVPFPPTEPPRVRLLGGVANVLAQLSREQPAVTVLDDIHWADGSSWEALSYLAHNLTGCRILLVLAARPVELAAHEVATQVLLGLEQDGYLTRLELAPFAPDEVAELARAYAGEECVGDALVAWLMERSRGTPLFATGLLRSLLDEGADLGRPALRVLPEDLAERITVRLRDLDRASRAVLEMLTVLGSRVTFGQLLPLCGQPLEQLAELLDGLVRTRLVHQLEQGRDLAYELGHPLYQEAVYQSIGAARRRALHRHVARALVAAGRPGAAAPHFLRSADEGDPEAVDALRDALAQAEARELHREALALLEALLELLPAGDERWIGVHDAMGRQPEWIVDHRADVEIAVGLEAMRRIDQVLARSAPGNAGRRASVKLNLAVFVGWGRGDTGSAVRLAGEAERLFSEGGDPRGALLARNEIGYLHWIAGDMRGFDAAAREVLEGGEAAGDRFVILQGLCALAHTTQLGGDVTGSLPILERAVSLAREDGKLYRTSYLLAQTAFSLGLLGQLGEARDRLAEGRAANPAFRTTVLLDYAMQVDWLAGDLVACLDSFREQLGWTGGHSRRRALGSSAAAIAAAELGDRDGARSIVAGAAAVTAGRDEEPQSDQMRWAAGVGAWLAGDGPRAVGLFGAALCRQREGGWAAGPFARFIAADLTEVAARAGDETALTLLDDPADPADRHAGAPLDGLTQFVRAGAQLARGSALEATEALRTAAEAAEQAGWRLLHGRALALLGQAAAVSGQRDLALDVLPRAAERFEACGAAVRRDWALEDLRRLGARGRRASAAVAGPAALTRREREVVRLAIAGHSAREIAQQLFIGERTVETHLAGAYAKLGINSRRELARLAPDLDL